SHVRRGSAIVCSRSTRAHVFVGIRPPSFLKQLCALSSLTPSFYKGPSAFPVAVASNIGAQNGGHLAFHTLSVEAAERRSMSRFPLLREPPVAPSTTFLSQLPESLLYV